MGIRNAVKAVVGVVALTGAVLGASPSAAAADPITPQEYSVYFVSGAGLACGSSTGNPNWRYYKHCTGSGNNVQVLARFIFDSNKIACVGPGQAVKIGWTGSYSLDWNGLTCGNPGSVWNA